MFGLFLLSLIITVVGSQTCPSSIVMLQTSVSMCSKSASEPGRRVYLSGFGDGEGDQTCQCSLTLTGSGSSLSEIIITDQNNGTSNSCDYSLVLVEKNKTDTTIYNCNQGVQIERSFSMYAGEEVKLKLKHETSNNAGFQFCLQFKTTANMFNLNMNCSKAVSPPITKTSVVSSTAPSPPTSSSSPTETRSTKTSTLPPTADTASTSSSKPSSALKPSTETSSNPINNKPTTSSSTTFKQPTVSPTNTTTDDVGLIVGVALAAVAVIVIIGVIIFCLVRMKRKKNYDKPTKNEDQEHSYLDIRHRVDGIQDGGAHDSNQVTKTGNGEMEVLENDLYRSMDDDGGRRSNSDSGRGNGISGRSNGVIEIIENDMYRSMDDYGGMDNSDGGRVNGNSGRGNNVIEIIENDMYRSMDEMKVGHGTRRRGNGDVEILENELYRSIEEEEKTGGQYVSIDSRAKIDSTLPKKTNKADLNNVEPEYAVVDKKKKRNKPETQNSEVVYIAVNKKKKVVPNKPNTENSDSNIEYAVVNKRKK